jgi:CRISPR-associated protein Cas1
MNKEVIINTYGSYLHVKDEMFEIKNKAHQTQLQPIPPNKVRTFALTAGTAMSTDVLLLALKNQVDIVIIDEHGHPIGRFWHMQLGSTSKIVKQQARHATGQQAVLWVKKWIDAKITHQRDFLQDLKKHRVSMHDFLNTKMESLENQLVKIAALQGEQVSDIADTLRGHEGTAGRLYWEAISEALPSSYQFASRSHRPAQDAFNACLNYAYGILYRRVERALLIAGLQPQIGFFHRDDYNHKSMLYDFIEPYRIWADVPVFRLFSGKKINDSHTHSIPKGIGLTPDGKKLVAMQLIDYLDTDTIKHLGRNQCRENILRADAHHFANALLDEE